MSTLSTAELEAQIETDLSDTALQQIIDACERDIDDYVGPATGHIVEFEPVMQTVLMLPVPAASITSIVEYTDAQSDPTKTTLSADDYELSDDGREIRRLSDGTNERSTWGFHVVVTYAHAADTDRRKQVAIELARLEITHSGYSRETVGDWSASTVDLDAERKKILRRLNQSHVA